MKIWLTMLAAICWMAVSNAQDISVKGIVTEEMLDGKMMPLEFTTVYWMASGHNTTTDSTGYFFIQHGESDGDKLIFSYLGFDPDTIMAHPGQYISVVFKEQATVLGEVVVAHHRRTTEVSFLNPLQMQSISKEELFKAACCNLSESFATNATVDVSFTDAVTGAKEIQMLGLSGKYSLISQEQIPGIRGLAIPYGLLYTPGPWIESIQISKGAGSVLQGYESMTGQINVELKKPEAGDHFMLNGFYNESSRSEINLFTRTDISPILHTAILGHFSVYPQKNDRNEDGFTDTPTGNLITLANRWELHNEKTGVEGQFFAQWLKDKKESGTILQDENNPGYYKATIDAERLQLFGKLGFVFPEKRYNSIGTQWGYTHHTQTAIIGDHNYHGKQSSFYGNWLYRSILGDTRHQYFAGLSFRYDQYHERLDSMIFDRKEIVPGVFVEYTYKPGDHFSLVAGVRLDHHNLYGWMFNPRFHIRYAPVETTVLRFSVGRGMRSPLPIVENLGALASSRQWSIGDPGYRGELPYNGLNLEKAWNFGASITQEFKLDYRSGVATIDFYHTLFTDRTIADFDISPQELVIYNLLGKSRANTFQAEVQYELLKRLDVKTAYKWQDSKIDYADKGWRQQTFTPESRFFVNVSYQSSIATYKGHWRASATAQYVGTQRIPDTGTNPAEFQLPSHAPDYWLINAQWTWVFKKGPEFYVGAENIFDFRESPVILDAQHPQSPYFDSSLIWGPIFGREWYVGFRYNLK